MVAFAVDTTRKTLSRVRSSARKRERQREREGERERLGERENSKRETAEERQCAQGGLSLSRGELRVNVRELGHSVPHLGMPEAMCRGSMFSVLERASPQPSSDTNGRFFPLRKLALYFGTRVHCEPRRDYTRVLVNADYT